MHPNLAAFPTNTYWLPLGFSAAGGSHGSRSLVAASRRLHAMSFMGNDGNQKMRHTWLADVRTLGWTVKGNLSNSSFAAGSEIEYAELMRTSSYCLAPPGVSIESFRLYDALELGCVPVLLDEWVDANVSLPHAPFSHFWHNFSEPLWM